MAFQVFKLKALISQKELSVKIRSAFDKTRAACFEVSMLLQQEWLCFSESTKRHKLFQIATNKEIKKEKLPLKIY